MVLVDTSVWIDFLRGTLSQEARVLTERIESSRDIGICGIIRQEILQGVRNDFMVRRVLGFLDQAHYFRMEEPSSFDQAAEVYRGLKKRGITIRSAIDCLIAAVAMSYDIPILHRDKDYDRIARYTKLAVYRL